jgi:hypothetical protein
MAPSEYGSITGMILFEVAYIVVATLLFMFISQRITRWAMFKGMHGPESVAKTAAMTWRFSEVGLAALILFILWVPILRLGVQGPWTVTGGGVAFFFAAAYSLLFGGLYIVASAFAGITVPRGNQVAYFNDIYSKM